MASSSTAPSLPASRLQPWLWSTFLALVMAVPLLRQGIVPPRPALPVLGSVPSFRLVDESGSAFGPERLAGRVWLADFIFTRCPSICPELTERLVRVQKQLGDQVDLVSVSVDPAYDTPERMRAFAERHRALSPRWHFLTSDRGSTEDTVSRGFKIALTRDSSDAMSITHGAHVVLVDGQGRIRGYYDSSDPDALERLVTDARRLAASQRG
jgi:protein SCO1/2